MIPKARLRWRAAGKLFGRRMPQMPGSSPAGVLPPGYSAWLAQAIAFGATPPDVTKAAMLQFYAGMATAGLSLSDFDWAQLLIGENPADSSTNKYNQKRVNVFNPAAFNGTVYNANASGHGAAGTIGDGSMYILNDYRSGTMPVDRKFSASMGAVVTATPSPTGTTTTMGIGTGSHNLRAGYGDARWGGYGTPFFTTPGAETFPRLLYTMTDSSNTYIYRGTDLIATDTNDPTTIPDLSASIFSLWNGTNPFQLSSETIAFVWHGRAFTGPERAAWYSIIQTLMSAFGVDIVPAAPSGLFGHLPLLGRWLKGGA